MVALALELGHDDLVDVEEAVLLEPDLDERCLHPGQDVVDDAEVDVAGDRAPLGPLEVDLGDAIVLDHGDALLADVDRDQQLALRGRQRRPPWRLAATLGAAALASGAAPVGGPLGPLAPRRLAHAQAPSRSSPRRRSPRAVATLAGRPLPATTATAAAPSLVSQRLCVRACRGRFCGRNALLLGLRLSRGGRNLCECAVRRVLRFFLFFHRNQGKECLSSL